MARLQTAPLPLLVEATVLPAHNWRPPRALHWLHSATECSPLHWDTPIVSDNPPQLLFLERASLATAPAEHALSRLAAAPNAASTTLPWESGALHHPALPEGSRVLAPWGIDAATDGLFELDLEADAVLLLFADTVPALHWGLHDWAHFHSHGPFERVAETELQCDVSALCWAHDNLEVLGLDRAAWQRMAEQVLALWPLRFAEEQRTPHWQQPLGYLRRHCHAPDLSPP